MLFIAFIIYSLQYFTPTKDDRAKILYLQNKYVEEYEIKFFSDQYIIVTQIKDNVLKKEKACEIYKNFFQNNNSNKRPTYYNIFNYYNKNNIFVLQISGYKNGKCNYVTDKYSEYY